MNGNDNSRDGEEEEEVGPPPMPWFGMDIGGTLAKLVYFEPTDGKTGNKKTLW